MATTEIGELQVLITAKSDEFNSEINKMRSQLGSLEKSVNLSGNKITTGMIAMGSTIGNVLSNVFTKVASTIANNIDYATKRLDTLNRFPIILQNLGVSADDAGKAVNTLADYTLGLPTTLNDAAQSVQYFTSATGNVKQSISIFEALNDAIVSGAQSAEIQSTALEQWSQAIVRGSFDIEGEFNALVVANAKAVNEISEKLLGTGKDFNDLYSALKKGTVSVYDMCDAMIYLDKNGVNGLESWSVRARDAISGIDVAITRFKTNIGKAVAVVADEIGWKNIYTFINNVGDAIFKAGQYIAAFVRMIKQAVAWVSVLFGGSGSTAGLVEETGEASNNVSNIASGASDASSGLSDATSQAKKLKKQLAGFDELNIIRENDSSDSGSKSGGGGGSFKTGDFNWDSGLESYSDKVGAIFDKLWAKISSFFDLDKIGKASERFIKDIKSALQPIAKIASDIWNDYLKPFLQWTGNELLPAFLNAVGGAINFIGQVLGTYWTKYLKPFVDAFLVPIAKFTGGVIVKVLNGIGDGLRALANNQTALDIMAGILDVIVKIGLATAAVKVIQTIGIALGGIAGYATSASSSLGFVAMQIGMTTNNMNMFTSGAKLATTASFSLKSTLSGIGEAIFSPMSIAILAVVAAFEAYQVISEYAKLKTMEAELAEKNFTTAEKLNEEATRNLNDAIQRQIDLKNELAGLIENETSAKLNLANANETLKQKTDTLNEIASAYNMTTDEARKYVENLDVSTGVLSEKDKKLLEAVAAVDEAQQKQTDATNKLSEATQKITDNAEEYTNMVWKQKMSEEQERITAMLSEGQYDKVAEALSNLTDETVTYTDENGRQCQLTKEDMESMANFIGDRLADIDEDNGKAWNNIWKNAEYDINKIKDKTKEGNGIGSDFVSGIKKGAEGQRTGLLSTIGNIASGMINTMKSWLGIHSPSKEMAKVGRFFDLGLAQGMNDSLKEVRKASSNLVQTAMKPFSGAQFAVSTPDLSLSGSISQSALFDIERSEPVAIQVNVGGDTLVDKVVDGINDRSFLSNKAVINV